MVKFKNVDGKFIYVNTYTFNLLGSSIMIVVPKKIKRIGANKQMQINTRNLNIKEFFNSKIIRYIGYTLLGATMVSLGYIMFVSAILLDPSNPYN